MHKISGCTSAHNTTAGYLKNGKDQSTTAYSGSIIGAKMSVYAGSNTAVCVPQDGRSTSLAHRYYRHFSTVLLRDNFVLQQLPGYTFDRLARVHTIAIDLHQDINQHTHRNKSKVERHRIKRIPGRSHAPRKSTTSRLERHESASANTVPASAPAPARAQATVVTVAVTFTGTVQGKADNMPKYVFAE